MEATVVGWGISAGFVVAAAICGDAAVVLSDPEAVVGGFTQVRAPPAIDSGMTSARGFGAQDAAASPMTSGRNQMLRRKIMIFTGGTRATGKPLPPADARWILHPGKLARSPHRRKQCLRLLQPAKISDADQIRRIRHQRGDLGEMPAVGNPGIRPHRALKCRQVLAHQFPH